MRILLIATFVMYNLTAISSEVKEIEIQTERGDKIKAYLHLPLNRSGHLPALIIGAGQGYHMDLPLIKLLANKAAANNIIALRFDWHYFTNSAKPSHKLLSEKQDMMAALKYIKGLKAVDKSKIMLAGKSLGTHVAHSIFSDTDDLHSLYLLTPVCTWHWDKEGNKVEPFPVGKYRYKGLLQETRPVHLILGNKDRLCHISMLYDYLKFSKGNISTTIFAGDHGMNIGKWDDPKFKKRNDSNVRAATNATAHWININLDK